MKVLRGAIQSFYSGAFYGELARRWRGIGMRFILLLTLVQVVVISALAFSSPVYNQARAFFAHLPEKAETLPALMIKDGKLSIDRPVPYKVNFGEAPDDVWIVIDTDYTIPSIDALEKHMRDDHIFVLVTQDKIISRDFQNSPGHKQPGLQDELKITDLKDVQNSNGGITHENWHDIARVIQGWGMTMIVSFALTFLIIGELIVNLLATVFSAIFIMILDLFAKTGLEFAAGMRLAAAARIPITFIGAVPLAFGIGLSGIADWLLWLIYLIFAVWAVKFSQPRNP